MNKRTGVELSLTALLGLLVSLIAIQPALRKIGGAWGQGDMLSTYVNVNNWGWLGYSLNTHYGYPLGIDNNLFPNIDITQNYIAKVLTLLTGNSFAGINMLIVLSFPLIAALAYLALRLAGLNGPVAIALAVAFTMIPFHFGRALGHTYLAVFYGAVAGVILAQLIGTGRMSRLLSRRRQSKKQFVVNVVAITALITVTAWSGVYYSVFGLILMTTAWLWYLTQTKNVRKLALAAVPILSTAFLSIVGFIPALIALRNNPPYLSLGERLPFESVTFAGNLAVAILPAPISQLSFLSFYNVNVSEAFNSAPNFESNTLTNSGTWITFASLLFVLWALLTRYRARLGLLLTLTFVALLFFVPWGFNYLFAAIVTPQIRAWNRLVPILLLLVILLAAAVLSQFRSIHKVGIALSIAVMIIGITAIESVWPFRETYARDSEVGSRISQSAQEYAKSIDLVLPQNCGVLQLPYMVYPENAPILRMNDYDHFWPSLVSTNKSWSYGAVKNTKASAWMASLPEIPTPADIDILGSAGFCGIHLDTRAWVNPAADRIIASLSERYGPPQVTQRISGKSKRDDWVFFVTSKDVSVVDPMNWSAELTNWFYRPAITTSTNAADLTVAPRGSKDALTWWWTIKPEAVFTFHQLDDKNPLTSISGGLRIPECADLESSSITLTLNTGESLIIEANAKKTTDFVIDLKDSEANVSGTKTTLTVSSPIKGCQSPGFGYPQFVQVIDLVSRT